MGIDLDKLNPLISIARIGVTSFVAGMLSLIASDAASETGFLDNQDRNYFVRAIDWRETGIETRLLILTFPAPRQAHAREECTANFYELRVSSGSDESDLRPVSENHCGHRLDRSGRLLDNGDVVLLIGGRVETWRPGVGRISDWLISDVEPLQRHHSSLTKEVRVIDAHPGGLVAFAGGLPRGRGDFESPSAVIVGFSSDGKVRWEHVLAVPGIDMAPMDIWATADGGALLHVVARPMDGPGMPEGIAPAGMTGDENRLYRISAAGEISAPVIIARFHLPLGPIDLPNPVSDPEAYRESMIRYQDSASLKLYTFGQLVGHARSDDSVDLLLGRGTRDARFVRVDRQGMAVIDETLTDAMNTKERPPWQDGYVSGQTVFLFGVLGLKETRLPQGYVSRFDLGERQLTTSLAPLLGPGLDESIRARDEERQYLEHDPAQEPQLLARVAGRPLLVSAVKRSRRQALQFTEDAGDLQQHTRTVPEREPSRRETRRSAPVPEPVPDGCECSCELMAEMQRMTETMQSRMAAGQSMPAEELVQMSQCMSACQPQLMACLGQQ